MKIFKVAQAGGGKRNVKVVIDMATGEVKITVTGHSEGSSCSDKMDEGLMKLLNGGDKIIDQGLTSEAYEERAKALTPRIPEKVAPQAPEPDLQMPEQSQRALDRGFGV